MSKHLYTPEVESTGRYSGITVGCLQILRCTQHSVTPQDCNVENRFQRLEQLQSEYRSHSLTLAHRYAWTRAVRVERPSDLRYLFCNKWPIAVQRRDSYNLTLASPHPSKPASDMLILPNQLPNIRHRLQLEHLPPDRQLQPWRRVLWHYSSLLFEMPDLPPRL